MSDDDRLADYFQRMENADYRRDLEDGCACGLSLAACNASRYIASTPCCSSCSGH